MLIIVILCYLDVSFIAIPTEPNGGNHTIAYTKAAATQEAHDATMLVTKGLATTGFRVLHDAVFLRQVSICARFYGLLPDVAIPGQRSL